MKPIIINNELSGSVMTIYDNGSSLAIDGIYGTYFIDSIAESAELTLSNIAIGVKYIFKIYNSVADNTSGNGVYVTINSGATHLINYHSKNVFIAPLDYIIIELIYDGTNYIYTLTRGKELTKTCTIVIAYNTSAANINTIIESIPKDLNGHTLTTQYADCPYKNFNGTTDKIIGNGLLATVTHVAHGFIDGDILSLNVLREMYFSGLTTIVGNGTTATVNRNAHGFIAGDYITIIGTTNFDGTYEIQTKATNSFTILHAYNGTETAPATAAINTLDFDGDYTITVVNEDTYTFAHTSSGQTTPLATGIIRKIWDLGSSTILYDKFINGVLKINGTSQATTLNNYQKTYFKSSSAIVVSINNSNILCYVRQLKLYGSGSDDDGQGVLNVINSKSVLIMGCFVLAKTTSYGTCVSSNYGSIISLCRNCYTEGWRQMLSFTPSMMYIDNNYTYRHSGSTYGIYSLCGIIFKKTNYLIGSTSEEYKINGGQIFS